MMSKRSVAGHVVLVLAAMATGLVTVKPVMKVLMNRMTIAAGPWRTTLAAGSESANPYERAAIALVGLYALGRQETLYYTAYDDSDGRPLDGRCDYALAGRPLPARWWSLTLYGADNYLVPNAANLYSRHANNLETADDGAYAVAVSATPQPKNWLPSPAEGNFSITARLYNPDPAVFADLSNVALPTIARGACR